METCSKDVDKFVAHLGKMVEHEKQSCRITAEFVMDLEQMVASEPFVGLASAMQSIVDGLSELVRVREQVMCARLDDILREAAPSEATPAPATASARVPADASACGLKVYVREQCIDPLAKLLKTRTAKDGGGDANGGDGGGSGEEDRGICTLTLRRMFPSFALVAFQNWQSHGVLMPALGRLFQSEDPGSDGDKGTSKTNPKLDKDGDGDVLAGTVRSAEVATAEQTPRKKAKHSDTTTATGTAKTQKLKIR